MNLWTDLDNSEQQSLNTAGQGRSLRLRRLTEHAIFSELRSWLLQDYVASYCRSLAATRIFRRCYWIDALGSTRAPLKKSGESQGRDETGHKSGRGGGRDESRPYIFDDIAGTGQSNHSASRTGKAAKKAHSE